MGALSENNNSNEDGEAICYKDRKYITKEDIYRSSALWLTNTRREILLAQRAFTKDYHPEHLDPAVAGNVEEAESYEENIIKEREEELGIKRLEIKKGSKTRTKTSGIISLSGLWLYLTTQLKNLSLIKKK